MRSVFWILLSLASLGCSASVHKLYSGPDRPLSQVSRIEVPPGAQLVKVDRSKVNVPGSLAERKSGEDQDAVPTVEVLPGCRTLVVTYQATYRRGPEPDHQPKLILGRGPVRVEVPLNGSGPHEDGRPTVVADSGPVSVEVPLTGSEKQGSEPDKSWIEGPFAEPTHEWKYRVTVRFSVRLEAGHSYQVMSTLVGDEFHPRLVVMGPDGTRLGALPASGSKTAKECTSLESVLAERPQTPPKPDAVAIRRALEGVAPSASSCLQRSSSEPISTPVAVSFSADGRALEANITTGDLSLEETACVQQRLLALRVPGFLGDPITVKKTLSITPTVEANPSVPSPMAPGDENASTDSTPSPDR